MGLGQGLELFRCLYSCFFMEPTWNGVGSMYGMFTYMSHKKKPSVGKYAIHESYEIVFMITLSFFFVLVTWPDTTL